MTSGRGVAYADYVTTAEKINVIESDSLKMFKTEVKRVLLLRRKCAIRVNS